MSRRVRLLAAAAALVIAAGSAAVASASAESRLELCGRYAASGAKNSRYLVMNNVWGATTAQCIEVGSDGAFRVARSEHRNTDAAASYPSIYAGCHWGRCTRATNLPMRVDRLRSARSTWSITTDAEGVWNAAYDLWFHTDADINRSPDGAELMIWLDSNGGANPRGTVVARNVRLAGATWDIWYADDAWNYIAYVRTSPTTSVRNLDLRSFIHDSASRGYVRPSWHLSAVEAGFEIWRDGAGLESTSFAMSATSGPTSAGGPGTGDGSAPAPSGPTTTPTTTGPGTTARCSVRWSSNTWNSGLVAGLIVVNHGAPLTGWEVSWTFRDDERVDNDWGAEITQSGQNVLARNAPYNGSLAKGAKATFGFQASHGGSPKRPADFRLNGERCTLE